MSVSSDVLALKLQRRVLTSIIDVCGIQYDDCVECVVYFCATKLRFV